MNKNHDFFMKKACDLAEYSISNRGGPFGAVIIDKNKNIVGEGYNTVTINNDPTQHAEIVAIRDACNRLNMFKLEDCTIYCSCEPCPMCLSAIYWSKINNIYYANTRNDAKNIGFDDEFIYDEISKKKEKRKIYMEKYNCEYAKKSFELWSDKKDKIDY
jgi:guanine deaminase